MSQLPSMPKHPAKKVPPDDPNKAAKAVVDRVIDETEKGEPSDDPNVAGRRCSSRPGQPDVRQRGSRPRGRGVRRRHGHRRHARRHRQGQRAGSLSRCSEAASTWWPPDGAATCRMGGQNKKAGRRTKCAMAYGPERLAAFGALAVGSDARKSFLGDDLPPNHFPDTDTRPEQLTPQ